MKIAVLLGGITYDSQQRTIAGILKSSMSDGAEVDFFVCDAWNYDTKYQYENGEFNIYYLPDFSQFDGIIANFDTIHNLEVEKEVVRRIKLSHRPCVSINHKIDGINLVQLVNSTGIAEITEHLISKHGVRDIFHITGPAYNMDATERAHVVRSVMERHQLELAPSNVYAGDYSFQSGEDAIKEMFRRRPDLPQAIICANDWMAIGAIRALDARGYRVPEDVIVTGYDDSELGRIGQKRLTTVARQEEYAGKLAYDVVKKMAEGEEVEMEYYVDSMPIFGSSCGCESLSLYDEKALKNMYIKQSVETTGKFALLKYAAAEITGIVDYEEFLEISKNFIKHLDLNCFYMCLCGTPEIYFDEVDVLAAGKEPDRDRSEYTDIMQVPIAYENGEFKNLRAFHKSRLLPDKIERSEYGNFYFFLPLHHQSECYGYVAIGNTNSIIDSPFLNQFILQISACLHTIQQKHITDAMLGHLNKMWIHDELTGVYNRAGFKTFAPKILAEAKNRFLSFAIIFCDIDGLKMVNDVYGHEEGDRYIKAMSTIIEQNRHHGELLVRYGGDEFIILTTGYSEKQMEEYCDKIRESVKLYNELYKKEYYADISIGFHIEENATAIDIDRIIKLADQNMYEDKRRKKVARGLM